MDLPAVLAGYTEQKVSPLPFSFIIIGETLFSSEYYEDYVSQSEQMTACPINTADFVTVVVTVNPTWILKSTIDTTS